MSTPKPITIEGLKKVSQRGGLVYIVSPWEPDGYTHESARRFENWNCSNILIARGQVFSSKAKLLAYTKQLGWKSKDGVEK